MVGMNFETPWRNLTETYTKIWDYKIWKQKFQHNICHSKKWCIQWELLWFFEWNGGQKYIYYKLNYSIFYWWNNQTEDITVRGYHYYLYTMYETQTIDSLDFLPKFWLLSENNLEFYSQNDLEKLTVDQKNIFEKLEQSPSIVIDGIDYMKE